MTPLTPNAQFDDNRVHLSDPEPSRAPCSNCHHRAILSSNDLCADCEYEASILTHTALTNEPLYVLTPTLAVYTVSRIEPATGSYRYHVLTEELTDPFICSIEELFTSPTALALSGINKANDAILRLTHLLKQHLPRP
jgi:hypothetical protein